MSDKSRIIIFDTTMRDGEQSPGASMSLEEKLQISSFYNQGETFSNRAARYLPLPIE